MQLIKVFTNFISFNDIRHRILIGHSIPNMCLKIPNIPKRVRCHQTRTIILRQTKRNVYKLPPQQNLLTRYKSEPRSVTWVTQSGPGELDTTMVLNIW